MAILIFQKHADKANVAPVFRHYFSLTFCLHLHQTTYILAEKLTVGARIEKPKLLAGFISQDRRTTSWVNWYSQVLSTVSLKLRNALQSYPSA